jgi:1-acyl-sn-glycerol-3-phosphate acyltransferase
VDFCRLQMSAQKITPFMLIKKSALVCWVTLVTFYCLLAVYFHLWTKPRAAADKANQDLSMFWGKTLMKGLGVEICTGGAPISSSPTLFVGNHMSYLDIPIFFTLRNATFVAKREVSRWPIFGRATTSVGTIYVDRNSIKSRADTSAAMRSAIKDRGQSIVIFPEGTSSVAGKPWRQGALRMAKDAGLWVQPFCIYFTPARPAAYIDDDKFIVHLWQWVGNTALRAQIHFFEPRLISDAAQATEEIQNLVQTKWQDFAKQDS